jgi:tetratricopeptide (TPR) repeat protein
LDSRFFQDLSKRSPLEAARVVADAAAYLENEAREHSSPILEARLGKIYLHLGRTEEAAAVLSRALSKLPNLSKVWSNLGLTYARTGQDSPMKQCFEKAVFLDPNDFSSLFHLAELYDRTSRIDDALPYYRQALEGWLNQPSPHAQRASRIYHCQYTAPDDVIPNGLLAYCSPMLDARSVASKLATLYEWRGDQQLMDRYRNLSLELASSLMKGE